VLTTLEESFEPAVIFFGLINSPVTFQIIMNRIFQDLIDSEEVVSFIDNIIRDSKEVDRK